MRRFALLVLLPLLLLIPRTASAEEQPLSNHQFAEWNEGLPTGWTTREGAKNGNSETRTSIQPVQGGGVSLVGGPDTHHWSMLVQPIDVRPGEYLELTFVARTRGLKLDPSQFGSCYVGFVLRDAAGKPSRFVIQTVRQEAWRTERLFLRVPDEVGSIEVALFLSMTGRLDVRRVGLRRLGPERSFETLVAGMDRHYSFFGPHKVDWKALSAKHAEAAQEARTPAAFVEAITPMLAELKDGHIWVDPPEGTRSVPWAPSVQRNIAFTQLLNYLTDLKQVIRNVLSARTKEGYGYMALGTMQGSGAQYAAVEQAWRGLFDAPAIILDLRMNNGGQELWGQRLLRFLTKTRVLYGRALQRSGPAYDDLEPAGDRYLLPSKTGHYGGPVVVLIGPGCVSSGEGMAMMLKALPQATLVGLPTRGSSGNPQPIHLPNGVTVWFSRWISLLPDRSPLERHGVTPDIRTEFIKDANPSMDEALKILKAKLAGR